MVRGRASKFVHIKFVPFQNFPPVVGGNDKKTRCGIKGKCGNALRSVKSLGGGGRGSATAQGCILHYHACLGMAFMALNPNDSVPMPLPLHWHVLAITHGAVGRSFDGALIAPRAALHALHCARESTCHFPMYCNRFSGTDAVAQGAIGIQQRSPALPKPHPSGIDGAHTPATDLTDGSGGGGGAHRSEAGEAARAMGNVRRSTGQSH